MSKLRFSQENMFGDLLNSTTKHSIEEKTIPMHKPKKKKRNTAMLNKIFEAFSNPQEMNDGCKITFYTQPMIKQLVKEHCVKNNFTMTEYINKLVINDMTTS